MDQIHYAEMKENVQRLTTEGALRGKQIYLFGHCGATEELADLLLDDGYSITAILDNNKEKYGGKYRDMPIEPPASILRENADETIVCIVTRFYEAMNAQLRTLGFAGRVEKLVDYNTYAEYSLSQETMRRKRTRAERGMEIIGDLKRRYTGHIRIFCPYSSLGDVYYCMAYLPHFLERRGTKKAVVCVYTKSCKDVVLLFGAYSVELLSQKDLDAAVQAAIFFGDADDFIAHNDKPYVVNLPKALYIKKISFEVVYKCGVFGLPADCKAYRPIQGKAYSRLRDIPEGRSVILSPYAGSVPRVSEQIWAEIIEDYKGSGYACFTNTAQGEPPLPGTEGISPTISEIVSVVERAGTFIGLRSGLCDVVQSANCRKYALYPDYNFSGTKWKAIDIFRLDGFNNMVVYEDFNWKTHWRD